MVTIVDQYGNPIKREQLAEPQTARVGQLHQEFANHPGRGITPGKLARILQEAEQGNLIAQAELGEDMEERDGHIFAELSKRRRALLTVPWQIVPPPNPSAAEIRLAELATELLTEVQDIEDVIVDALDAIGHGYSCQEIEWYRVGSTWLPHTITHRPAAWFTVDRDTRTEIRLRDYSLDGQALQPCGWIRHVHKAKSGYIGRAGLHRVLSWSYLFKNYAVGDLAEFLEIYGLPLRVGTYPTGASEKEKVTLLRAVTSIGHSAAGIMPEGMKIEFQEAAKGASDPYMAMIDWCERTQSKAILGQTLSAEAKSTGLGNGVANLQSDVRDDIKHSDARQLAATLTRDLVYPILALNATGLEGLRRCPRLQFDLVEAEDVTAYADALPKLVGVGMQITRKWAHEKLRIPEPAEGDAVLSTAQPVPGVAGLRANLRGAVAALSGVAPVPGDIVDQQASRLERDADAGITQMIDVIRQIVDEAASLEDLRDRLLEAYPLMDSTLLADTMTNALLAASLAGRFDLLEGIQ